MIWSWITSRRFKLWRINSENSRKRQIQGLLFLSRILENNDSVEWKQLNKLGISLEKCPFVAFIIHLSSMVRLQLWVNLCSKQENKNRMFQVFLLPVKMKNGGRLKLLASIRPKQCNTWIKLTSYSNLSKTENQLPNESSCETDEKQRKRELRIISGSMLTKSNTIKNESHSSWILEPILINSGFKHSSQG